MGDEGVHHLGGGADRELLGQHGHMIIALRRRAEDDELGIGEFR
jgi:hypothetical protein